ncbi:MAG: glycosyl hydrolase family 79 C-terminal domain-containing protein [Acidobacteriaceae bacterium]
MAAAALSAVPSAQAFAGDNRLSFGKPSAAPVPLDYIGLSYETAQLADPSFFAPDNRELISLFCSLSQQGILRIGGNSSEFCWWKISSAEQPPPMPVSANSQGNWMPQQFTAIEPVAIDRLAGFLHATGWKAIYGLNLGTGTPDRDAEEAAYVAKTLGPRLLFFQIGNEPEYYSNASNRLRPSGWDFEQYLRQWLAIAHAVIQRVPHARFGGPDVGSNAEWIVRFAEEAPKALPGRIVACTGHYYAEGPPDSPHTTVERLLAPDLRFEDALDRMTAAAAQANIVYRMTEGNSCYRGGKPGLSNAFCSALWAAEFLLELASQGTAGVNLHGGGSKQIRMALGGHLPGEHMSANAAAAAVQGSFYTPIAGSREAGFTARPIFYGMKAAGVLAGGRMLPVHLEVSPVAATAWAAGMPDGSMRVIVLNKDPKQELALKIPSTHRATLWRLEAPSLTATSGVTLAGTTFLAGETWKPLREESVAVRAGAIQVTLPPASGTVIFLKNHFS